MACVTCGGLLAAHATGVSSARARHLVPRVDQSALAVSVADSGREIGFIMFTYGKKQERYMLAAAGVAFIVYPYFTPTTISMMVVGLLLGAGTWLGIRSGW